MAGIRRLTHTPTTADSYAWFATALYFKKRWGIRPTLGENNLIQQRAAEPDDGIWYGEDNPSDVDWTSV